MDDSRDPVKDFVEIIKLIMPDMFPVLSNLEFPNPEEELDDPILQSKPKEEKITRKVRLD